MEHDLTQRQPRHERVKANAAWLLFLCQTLETSIVVFTRSRFGARFFGVHAAAVIPLVLVYTLFWREYDPTPLWGFLGCYLLAWGAARAGILRRQAQGDTEHSFYSGTPSILRWPVFRRWLSERVAKAWMEPLLVLGIGMGLIQLSKPLGSYVMLAAAGMVMSMSAARAHERARLMDMRDAYIEQRSLAERFREGGWR